MTIVVGDKGNLGLSRSLQLSLTREREVSRNPVPYSCFMSAGNREINLVLLPAERFACTECISGKDHTGGEVGGAGRLVLSINRRWRYSHTFVEGGPLMSAQRPHLLRFHVIFAVRPGNSSSVSSLLP